MIYGGVQRIAAGKNRGQRVVRVQADRTRLHLLTASLCRLDSMLRICKGFRYIQAMYRLQTSFLWAFMLVS